MRTITLKNGWNNYKIFTIFSDGSYIDNTGDNILHEDFAEVYIRLREEGWKEV